jgi:probable F420-dependent oxidoreductase
MSDARPFRFGLAVTGGVSSREEWIALARRAEDLGYATLLVADHYVNEYPPIAVLMAAADATSTLRVGSYEFNNDFRHPVQLAKEVAALDRLSGGRFEMGLGAGWYQTEYNQVGLPFESASVRIRRLAEGVSIIKQFFTQDSITFTGEHYTVADLKAFPKSAQRPHPPILIGGGGMQVLTLAGREADIVGLELREKDDGTIDASERTEAALVQKAEWVRQAAGARFSALELNMLIRAVILTEDRQQAAEQRAREQGTGATVTAEEILANPYLLIGTVEQVVEALRRRREQFGISYLTVHMKDADVFAPVVARLAGS